MEIVDEDAEWNCQNCEEVFTGYTMVNHFKEHPPSEYPGTEDVIDETVKSKIQTFLPKLIKCGIFKALDKHRESSCKTLAVPSCEESDVNSETIDEVTHKSRSVRFTLPDSDSTVCSNESSSLREKENCTPGGDGPRAEVESNRRVAKKSCSGLKSKKRRKKDKKRDRERDDSGQEQTRKKSEEEEKLHSRKIDRVEEPPSRDLSPVNSVKPPKKRKSKNKSDREREDRGQENTGETSEDECHSRRTDRLEEPSSRDSSPVNSVKPPKKRKSKNKSDREREDRGQEKTRETSDEEWQSRRIDRSEDHPSRDSSPINSVKPPKKRKPKNKAPLHESEPKKIKKAQGKTKPKKDRKLESNFQKPARVKSNPTLTSSIAQSMELMKDLMVEASPPVSTLMMAMGETFPYRKYLYENTPDVKLMFAEFPALQISQILKREFELFKRASFEELDSKLSKDLEVTYEMSRTKYSQWPDPLLQLASETYEKSPSQELLRDMQIMCVAFDKMNGKLNGVLYKMREKGKPAFARTTPTIDIRGIYGSEGVRISVFCEGKQVAKAPNIYDAVMCVYSVYWIFNLCYERSCKTLFEYFDTLIGT